MQCHQIGLRRGIWLLLCLLEPGLAACVAHVPPSDEAALTSQSSRAVLPPMQRALGLFAWSPDTERTIDGEWAFIRLLRGERGQGHCLAAFGQGVGVGRTRLFLGSAGWVWREHVARAELPFESALAARVRELTRAGSRVYGTIYLHDDADDFRDMEHLVDFVRAAAAYRSRYPDAPLAGLLVDQETSTPEGDAALLELLERMRAARDALAPGLTIEVAIRPRWLRSRVGTDMPLAASLAARVDGVSLMAYSDEVENVRRWGEQLLEITDRASVTAEIVIELSSDRAAENETLARSLAQDALAVRRILDELDAVFAPHRSFIGMGLHHYGALFTALAGTTPWRYPEGRSCEAVGLRFR